MKKILSLLLVSILLLGLAVSFAEEKVKLAAIKGPTAMTLVKLFDNAKDGQNKNAYDWHIASSPDEIVPKILKGEVDIAAVPANLASVLYNKTKGGIVAVGINAYNVLYIAEKGDSVKSVQDLKGKTILLNGKGATPEAALSYLLEKNGLAVGKDVQLSFTSEPSETLAKLIKDDAVIALMPEPFLTAAGKKVENLRVALSVEEAFLALDPAVRPVTGVFVARKDFAEKNREALGMFIEDAKMSVDFVKNNAEEAAKLMEGFDIVKAPIAKAALPNIGLAMVEGEDMQKDLSAYLALLFGFNPKLVGEKAPDADFYFKK